jgi:hypothetical protein
MTGIPTALRNKWEVEPNLLRRPDNDYVQIVCDGFGTVALIPVYDNELLAREIAEKIAKCNHA